MSKPRRRRRSSVLPFFIPFVVVGVIVAFILLSGSSSGPGTLVVRAGYGGTFIAAGFTVNGATFTTPANVTLPAGDYTVDFAPLSWYATPSPQSVTVPERTAIYAFGTYTPISRFVGISSSAFNSTTISALHGVTPVVWVNRENVPVTILSSVFSEETIDPGQSFSYVFQSAGTYGFQIFGGASTLTVNVQ